MAFGDNLLALFLKAIAGIFQKDQAQNDVLVFGGLDGAAQFVGGVRYSSKSLSANSCTSFRIISLGDFSSLSFKTGFVM